MSKVFITGGCGFVGANLVAFLNEHEAGHAITVFDNESVGSREHIADCDVDFVRGDVRDPDALAAAMQGADAIVHLAADPRVMDSIVDPRFNFGVNAVGSFNVLCAARDAGVKRVICASTGGAILGEAAPPVTEDMAPRPVSPYGASKLAMEGYASAFAGSYGMSVVALRFSNLYGPRSFHKGSVVAEFCRRIIAEEPLVVYGDGSQIRDFLYCDDISAVIASLIGGQERSGVFQLGTGRPTSVSELVGLIRKTVGADHLIEVRHAAPRVGEVHQTWCSIDKARDELGYKPTVGLEDGLARTWRWFQSRDKRAHP